MLGGLWNALLALKSHLLLIKDGVCELLLLSGRRTLRFREAVLTVEGVLSRHGRTGRVQRALTLSAKLSLLICKGIDILLLQNKSEASVSSPRNH